MDADVYLYSTAAGTRQGVYWPIVFVHRHTRQTGYGCRIQVGEKPLRPGERRRLSIEFPTCPEEGLHALRSAGKLYLWEGRVVGEISLPQSEYATAD